MGKKVDLKKYEGDLIRIYLDEIGKENLLSREEEVSLSKGIEDSYQSLVDVIYNYERDKTDNREMFGMSILYEELIIAYEKEKEKKTENIWMNYSNLNDPYTIISKLENIIHS